MDLDSVSGQRMGNGYVQPIAPRNFYGNSSPPKLSPIAPAPPKTPSTEEPAKGAPASTRCFSKRAHRRTYQSVMSGSKTIAPLKKRDGEALWRKDIQYDFLYAVFSDPTPAFTNPGRELEKVSFADLYLQAMAKSTKCSKVLGEKLLGDRQAGIRIAMVCLLVNWGRMNTTLNFFPEMKTILRTYHPIPSLQTHDSQDYKQLQDAPRLKSILKGASEADEPTSVQDLEHCKKLPRTNPINLIFLLSFFSRVVERDMIAPFHDYSYIDLLMDTSKSSESRAQAFLWLIWAYLESPDFHDNVNNPFGPTLPHLRPLDESEMNKENIDTPAELLFANQMTLQRLAILETPALANSEETISDKTVETTKPEKTSDVPLVIPKRRLRSAKDRRIHDEFHALVAVKRSERMARRLARNNAVRDTWLRICDLDPIYDSDDDRAQAKINGKSHKLGPGVVSTGIESSSFDYGERSHSTSLALRRVIKRLKRMAKF